MSYFMDTPVSEWQTDDKPDNLRRKTFWTIERIRSYLEIFLLPVVQRVLPKNNSLRNDNYVTSYNDWERPSATQKLPPLVQDRRFWVAFDCKINMQTIDKACSTIVHLSCMIMQSSSAHDYLLFQIK